MLAMKEQVPGLRNGRPWRAKDIADIEMLQELTSAEHRHQHGKDGIRR